MRYFINSESSYFSYDGDVSGTIFENMTEITEEQYRTALSLDIVPQIPIGTIIDIFTNITTDYINIKIDTYNKENGVAFKDIDAFAKYAILQNSVYHDIAIRFMTYADNIWTTVRAYQANATAVPTETEFLAVLDSVVF
ncbi:hypothetical protein [Sulfuricurvum sp.]|uniref:hypothetical protein n=1 Tax=Sulfuricurvum sp. TaxID=2025608 RepID=UPI00260165E4|nr:hypothetical protein [Sulfuricurvum sp.]MDD2267465.1 hypothetical protein [Sulfuricurvum sp.]MDD2782814.1 hypothetical protein [Sulfuricurvum sp.]